MIDKEYLLSYDECLRVLLERLKEKGPSRIQLLVGPRQVGKTTLLLELEKKFGERAFYIALDSPEASLPGYWERFWMQVEAQATKTTIVLLDEIQTLPDWSKLLKAQWDRCKRAKLPIHVVATGSSALRLASGSRESLAGRFEKITMTHWTAAFFSKTFKLSQKDAVETYVKMGAYPGAFPYMGDFLRWKAYVRDAIVETAIGRDILSLAPIRRPALLRQVFAICMTLPAQIISLQKIVGQLQDAGAIETVAHYLALLEEAFLVAPIRKFSANEIRMRSSPPKIVVLSNAFLAATDQTLPPDPNLDPKRYGMWVENCCLATAWNAGQNVRYWREEPFEVDAIFEGSWGKWAVEIKTGSFDLGDLQGLLKFTQEHKGYRPLLLCDAADIKKGERLAIESLSWKDFLMKGLELRQ